MRLTAVFLILSTLSVFAKGRAQTVTIHEVNAPLQKVIKTIQQQTGYGFNYKAEILEDLPVVTVKVVGKSLKETLEQCLKGLPISFYIGDKYVVLSGSKIVPLKQSDFVLESYVDTFITVTGRVISEKGEPVSGASIRVKGLAKGSISGTNGSFSLVGIPANGVVVFNSLGYKELEIVANKIVLPVVLKVSDNILDETVVIGYGTTSKRYSTGSVSKISSSVIESQPVTNVLSALSGRAAGVFVQTTNGLPGGGINIQIRGKGSIGAGTAPLYIIDGVPFSPVIENNTFGTSTVNGPVSPLNSLNPSDIESISILKDADATAIYGSRAANGVVLINTKKGKVDKTRVEIGVYHGISKVANLPKLLSLKQYLEIRREAFLNDNKVPSSDPLSPNYAPDLTVWDTTTATDWTKYVLGGTGRVTQVDGRISGGSKTLNFSLGANFRGETNILPGDNLYQRGGIQFSVRHSSINGRLQVDFSGNYVYDNNKLANPSQIINDLLLPPNFPIFDQGDKLNWAIGINPVAEMRASSKIKTDNNILNTVLRYNLTNSLNAKISIGYNKINFNQIQISPKSSLNPIGAISKTNFGNNSNLSFIVEPQLSYSAVIAKSSVDVMIGGTWQRSESQGTSIAASNFNSESLLENIASAGTVTALNSYTEYKYASVYGKLTYNIARTYIANLTIRRDGSSRFGSGNQFGNFGALGGAWLFSNEDFIKRMTPFISYGKLRGSYGVTGNDQISDYQYLPTYANSGYMYQDTAGLKPARIANDKFKWESNKKLEFALELGLLQDRFLFNVNWYRNRSGNQLVSFATPWLIGFSSYQANLPAVVQNSGWEFELTANSIKRKVFNWVTSLNLTIPKNSLKSFDNLATSSYSKTLIIGEPITRIYGYEFVEVDPLTGIPTYTAKAGGKTVTPSSATDQYFTIGTGSPDFFGGISNEFVYKNWQFNIFGQFSKQQSKGGLLYRPGNQILNNYIGVMDRWQKVGDQKLIPKSSTQLLSYYASSSANYYSTAFLRVKNISLSYSFGEKWVTRNKFEKFRIYLEGQNLITIWKKGSGIYDPESGAIIASAKNVPPLKTFVVGLQLIF